MAIGEAFVNVRADLKPFAKDLEKGLRAILIAAEKKIVADANTGKGLQAIFAQQTEKGLSDGFDRGMRNGSRKALSTGEKFFAALADFADDGLSAIPAKVKAGILVGIIAAGTVAAPLIAGTLSAAVTAGLVAGAAGLGIALASQQQVVADAFKQLFLRVTDDLRSRASVFVEPLLEAADVIDAAYARVGNDVQRIFSASARFVVPLAEALTGFVEKLLPGVADAIESAGPVINALNVALPQLGEDIGRAFQLIADGSPEASMALRDFIYILGFAVVNLATMIRGLSELYYWLRIVAATMQNDYDQVARLFQERTIAAAQATPQFTEAITDLDGALQGLNSETLATRLSISKLVTEMFKGLDGSIQFEQAIDDLNESFREGNRELDVREEKGRKNLRLIEAAILGAAQQRDAEIQRAAETGRSIDSINAAYQRQIDQIVRSTGKIGQQDQAFQDLIATARSIPGEVEVEVKTPGLSAAIRQMRELARIATEGARAAAEAIRRSGGGAGLQTVPQYAAGDIVTRPTLGMIAEAGYDEAVIPDPAVMPDRAMELSNKFGLTSMIAETLGAARSVVNVYIGSERLREMVDFQVQQHGMAQAQALAYGPRR